VAEMFKHSIIDHHGKFNPNVETPRLKRTDDGLGFIIA
jgi:hypothetical protein